MQTTRMDCWRPEPPNQIIYLSIVAIKRAHTTQRDKANGYLYISRLLRSTCLFFKYQLEIYTTLNTTFQSRHSETYSTSRGTFGWKHNIAGLMPHRRPSRLPCGARCRLKYQMLAANKTPIPPKSLRRTVVYDIRLTSLACRECPTSNQFLPFRCGLNSQQTSIPNMVAHNVTLDPFWSPCIDWRVHNSKVINVSRTRWVHAALRTSQPQWSGPLCKDFAYSRPACQGKRMKTGGLAFLCVWSKALWQLS